MSGLLHDVNELDNLIRQLHKLASRIRSGENVDAWRECNGIIAMVTTEKQNLLKNADAKEADGKQNDK